ELTPADRPPAPAHGQVVVERIPVGGAEADQRQRRPALSLWDVEKTGRLWKTRGPAGGAFSALAFAPDGQTLAAAVARAGSPERIRLSVELAALCPRHHQL